MNRLRKGLVIGSLLSALFSGCSSPIESGEIIKKRYEPARKYTTHVIKPRSKPIEGSEPVEFEAKGYIDDEDFIIILRKGDQTRKIYVNKGIYDSLKVGDRVDLSKIPYEDSDPDHVDKK